MAGITWPISPAKVFARPTADQIWLGPTQRAALGKLAAAPGSAVRLVVGPPSCGKRTLLGHWTAQLDNTVVLSSRVPGNDARTLLSELLLSIDFKPWGLTEIDQRNLLTLFIQQRCNEGKRVIIRVEHADQLGRDAWQELDRLCSMLVDGRPALDTFLAGAPTLAQRITTSNGSWFASHWYACSLPAVGPADVADYIRWRLNHADLPETLFTPHATQLISRLSQGRFTAVNSLCQMSLALLRRERRDRVDVTLVYRSAADLHRRAGRRKENWFGKSLQERGYLLITRDGSVIERAGLRPKLLLGRGRDCDVHLRSPYLSRHHCTVVQTVRGYEIIDLQSVNGVLVNGRYVTRATLSDRDLIKLGPFTLVFCAARSEALATRKPAMAALSAPPSRPAGVSFLRRVK